MADIPEDIWLSSDILRLSYSRCIWKEMRANYWVSIYRCMAAQRAYLPVCVCARARMRAHTSVIKKRRGCMRSIFFSPVKLSHNDKLLRQSCARRLNCLPLAGEWGGECGRWLRGGKRILSFRLSRSVRFDSSDSKSIFLEFARFC